MEEKKYMRQMEFIALMRCVCGKFDEFLAQKGRQTTVFELLEENLTNLGLLTPDAEFISLSLLR